MLLPPFKIEDFFARYEFTTPYMLGSSDPESHSLAELLAMANSEDRQLWDNLRLGYTESQGLPLLRQEIAQLYQLENADNCLVFSGAEEGIFVAMQVLLQAGDHVVVLTPCYESLKVLPKAISSNVTEFSLDWQDGGWSFNLERFSQVVTKETRLVIINFPHNPTGFQPTQELFHEILAVVRNSGAYLFSDEVYRFSEQSVAERLPAAADCYDKALSLGVMSKSFGLPGLRIGWVAAQDQVLLQRLAAYKNFTTICNASPSEILALIALKNKDQILQRNRDIAKHNLDLLDEFFQQYPDVYSWYRPRAGFIAFPRLKLLMNINAFTEKLAQEEGVLLLPGSLFDDRNNHFRLGFGRVNLPEALLRLERFTRKMN